MSKEDIGKKVVVTPAWLEKYDYFTGNFRGKEGKIISFRPFSDMIGCPDESTDDDGVYIILLETSEEIRVRRFDFKFADD